MAQKYCQACGAGVPETLRLCPSCGAQQFAPTAPVAPVARSGGGSPNQYSPGLSPNRPTAGNGNVGAPLPYLARQGALEPGSLARRFVAYFLDLMALTFASSFIVALGYFVSLPSRNQTLHLPLVIALIAAYVLPFIYYTVMPASSHEGTLGKKLMGLKLLSVQGERLSKSQAFIRVLLMMLLPIAALVLVSISFGGMAAAYEEGLTASIGVAWVIAIFGAWIGPYLTVFFNRDKQTLFDMIAKTIVVKG